MRKQKFEILNFINCKHVIVLHFIFCFLFFGCNKGGNPDTPVKNRSKLDSFPTSPSIQATATPTPTSVASAISFDGIDSIDQVNSGSMRLNWTTAAGALSYAIYNVTSGTPVMIHMAASGETNYTVSSLTASTAYSYRVRLIDANTLVDSNTKDLSATTLSVSSPTGVTLDSPSTTTHHQKTVTVTVSGVENGDAVKIYTDASCTTEIGSETAAGATIQIISSTLTPPSTGGATATTDYTIYAKRITSGGSPSGCYASAVTYSLSFCPVLYGDWVRVPANSSLGTTTDFCVMKYEAKAWNDSSGNSDGVIDSGEVDATGLSPATATNIAVSSPYGQPWRGNIDQDVAKSECTALGGEYHLMWNTEWMTLAHNVEQVGSNWSGGVLARGFSASTSYGDGWTNSAPAPTTGANCLYNTGVNICASTGSHLYKRTLSLSNNDEIWDLPGNVYEWVIWDIASNPKVEIPDTSLRSDQAVPSGGLAAAWKDFGNGAAFTVTPTTSMPENSYAPYTANNTPTQNTGLGMYYSSTNGSGGAPLRGGRWYYGWGAGVFALSLGGDSSHVGTGVGFRCSFFGL
jgi:hypothetical protein